MESLLADTYRNRIQYELLQNSDDAQARRVDVLVSPGRFEWTNDGRPMDAADIESLCRSASSTKTRGSGSIGYRGIGFKSLAAISSRFARHVQRSLLQLEIAEKRRHCLARRNLRMCLLLEFLAPFKMRDQPALGAHFQIEPIHELVESSLRLDPVALLSLATCGSCPDDD